jgi:hypothetical protein
MKARIVCGCVAVCVVCLLILAAPAAAQWSAPVKVSDAIEGGVGGVSAARCGNTIVVGFGDTEPNRPNSLDGFAVSKNAGASFTDGGTLPVASPSVMTGTDTLGSSFGGGTSASNPSLACANSNVFYASVFGNTGERCSNPGDGCTGISVSTSTNGGTTWGLPAIASIQGADIIEFLAPTLAVDPTNPRDLYVAYVYTDITHNFFPDCDFTSYSVNIVESFDGGQTWHQPAMPSVDHACDLFGANPALTGRMAAPNIIVSPGGNVYVVDEFIGESGNPNAIHFMRSTDHGKTFSAPITVSTDAINNAMPQLAVDRTTSSFRGAIYLTWSGKPRGTTTEVLWSDSLNHGASFSFPRSVRGTSMGTQVDAVVAVDNDGQVATCYYVTGTNTPTSSSNYFYNCLTSFNHGATWASYQKLVTSAPVGLDALASDFLLQNDGFFTAFELSNSAGQRRVVGSISDNP